MANKGRQIKRNTAKGREQEQWKKLVQLVDALTSKVLDLEERLQVIECDLHNGPEVGREYKPVDNNNQS